MIAVGRTEYLRTGAQVLSFNRGYPRGRVASSVTGRLQTCQDLVMAFKPSIWYPIAVVLSVGNAVGAGFAVGRAEPMHAGVHVVLAIAFGLWAWRLRQGPRGSDLQAGHEGLDALEAEIGKLRQELSETQERLDFAERMLAQGPERRQVDQRRDPR
jgi:hypothetical protein